MASFFKELGLTKNEFDDVFYGILSKHDGMDREVIKIIAREFKNIDNPINKRWINSGFTDFDIYQDRAYKYQALDSFFEETLGSIQQLLGLMKKNNIDVNSIKNVCDFGCGIGLSSIYLSFLFKNAQIIAHDISVDELELLTEMISAFKIQNIKIIIDPAKLRSIKMDLLCCFEVIEHNMKPLDFFDNSLKPHISKYFAYAARFGKLYPGHFPTYDFNGTTIKSSRAGSKFLAYIEQSVPLKNLGHGWNGKPILLSI